jgi:DNA invertase Pin-like site-specific DNA recombinase
VSTDGGRAPARPWLCVTYFRVSTDRQGRSGLGLDAQREAVARHISGAGGVIVAEFEEVESGKADDRPKLRAALRVCRARRATLIIAKLDRLARNLAFIATLMDSGVNFVAVDNPHATRLTIHILAAVAEHERDMISQRTREALYQARARGVRLGNPRPAEACARAREALTAKADQFARNVAPIIEQKGSRRTRRSPRRSTRGASRRRGVPDGTRRRSRTSGSARRRGDGGARKSHGCQRS